MTKRNIDISKMTIADVLAMEMFGPPAMIQVLDRIVDGGILDLPFTELKEIGEEFELALKIYNNEQDNDSVASLIADVVNDKWKGNSDNG